MDTNKHTAKRELKGGNTAEVTIERGTWDEKVSLDGWETGTIKTHLIDRTEIVIKNKAGRVIVSGSELITDFDPRLDKTYIENNCSARIGRAGLTEIAYKLIMSAIDEADAAVKKTAKQIDIESGIAKQKAENDAWENSPAGIAERDVWERHEKLMREMDRDDSDY